MRVRVIGDVPTSEVIDHIYDNNTVSFVFEDTKYIVELSFGDTGFSCVKIVLDKVIENSPYFTETGYAQYRVTADCVTHSFSYTFLSMDIENMDEIFIKFIMYSITSCTVESNVSVSSTKQNGKIRITESCKWFDFVSRVANFVMGSLDSPKDVLLECCRFERVFHRVIENKVMLELDSAYFIAGAFTWGNYDCIECYVGVNNGYIYCLIINTDSDCKYRFILRNNEIVCSNYVIRDTAFVSKRLL